MGSQAGWRLSLRDLAFGRDIRLRAFDTDGVAGSMEHHWAHLPLLSSLNDGK